MKQEDALSVKEMTALENKAFESGVSVLGLMERAGFGCADIITKQVGTNKRVLIFCGPGNNGGDGLVCARYLSSCQSIFVVLPIEPKTDAAIENYRLAKEKQIKFLDIKEAIVPLKTCDVIVDALLGIGSKSALRSPIKEASDLINSSGAIKISIDVPTGMDADTGHTDAHAVLPDATLCIHAPKKGVLLERDKSGKIWIVNIGL